MRGFIMTFDKLKTVNDLCVLLGIKQKLLKEITSNTNRYYHVFSISKKSGGQRTICAPQDELKAMQRTLARKLCYYWNKVRKENEIRVNIAHGFEKDRNIITNAKIHRNKRYVINLDLENYFDSFNFGRVTGFFQKNKYFALPKQVANTIAQISCYQQKLPQGSPCSPIITNLICQILDMRLLKIAKKYMLDYTRYADDLTFSTNDKGIINNFTVFLDEISEEIHKSGFKINSNKIRIQYKYSRQTVTGLVVNKKINIRHEYYKKVRAMAHTLYTTKTFNIDGKNGNANQLEGMFSFIHQIDEQNKVNNKKVQYQLLNSRDKQYCNFLFYKYFYANPRPLIVTEGKTDVKYIKAALRNLHSKYPSLVQKREDGTFEYRIAFLRRSKLLKSLFGLSQDGADSLSKLYYFFTGINSYPNLINKFNTLTKSRPINPVIFVFDNEISCKDKPISKLLKNIGSSETTINYLSTNLHIKITDNLYLLTNPLVKGLKECEIEDLFDDATLNKKIKGKNFSRESKFNTNLFFGKEKFSEYILANFETIDFSNFERMFNVMETLIESYNQNT